MTNNTRPAVITPKVSPANANKTLANVTKVEVPEEKKTDIVATLKNEA